MSDVMTQPEQRAALAAAVDGVSGTVDGITKTISGKTTQPVTPQPYDAWPVWLATRPVTFCVDETDWSVLVALPGTDAQTWTAKGDALVIAVAEALAAWKVSRIEPVQILLGEAASMPGLQFTVEI